MSQTLEFVSPSGNLTLGESEIVAKDLAKVHTGVGDARVEVPENDAIIPYVQRQDRVNYYVDGTAVFTGYAVGFQGDQRSGRWTLRVDGIAKRLEETRPDYATLGGPLVYENIGLDDAIADYWGRTPFSATVTAEPTSIVASNEQLQEASTNTEWQNVTSLSDTDPFIISGDSLQLTQSAWTRDAEDYDRQGGIGLENDSVYVDGQAVSLNSSGDYLEYDITLNHTIPGDNVSIYARLGDTTGTTDVTITVDGHSWTPIPQGLGLAEDVRWYDLAADPFAVSGDGDYDGGDISGNITVRFESSTSGQTYIDVIAPLDNRYNYTFDNTVDADGQLSGPELYPDAAEITLNSSKTAYNITEATITSTWDDTSNQQRLSLSNNGGQSFFSASNTSTYTQQFSSPGREAVAKIQASRYGTQSLTPTSGVNGQTVQNYELTADLNDRTVIDRLELSRDHFANLKTLHNYGDYLYTIEHGSAGIGSLTVESYPRGEQTRTTPAALNNPENKQPEVAAENYFNSIYLEGAIQPDGTRPTASVSDSNAISNDRGEITPGVLRDQNISTEAGATFRANALLEASLQDNELRGTVNTAPVYIHPGYSYSIDFGDGANNKTLESVSIRESSGSVSANYEFVTRERLSETIDNLKRESRDIGNQV